MWSTCKIPEQDKRSRPDGRMRYGRVNFFFLVIVAAGAAIGLRLFFLQVLNHEKWIALAEDQHLAFQTLAADRGEIHMRDGESEYPIAVNREYEMVYVSPEDVTDKDKTALELSSILGLSAEEIRRKVSIPDDPFEIIKKRVTEEEAEKIRALDLDGVGFLPEKYRYYPAGELASQVVGFVPGGDTEKRKGYGIEAALDASLRGIAGELEQEKDAAGRWIPLTDRSVISAQDGDRIVLTLDRVIQYETEKILRETVEEHEADGATAIVMDPNTGAILSMASFPQFDPNTYAQVEDYSVFLNPAVSLVWEPGSIMKPLTMAIGIEEGKVTPETEFVDPGSIREAGYTISNSENKSYGRSSMTKVLEESINTGVIYVEKLVGNQRFGEYVRQFGFGVPTKVSLPAELPGNIKNLENVKSDIQFFTASFGQGITVTPLQMVTAYAVLANGGTLLKPQIIDRILHADGTDERFTREEVRRVISPETSHQIGRMLRSVVVSGHGKRADVPGYLVGGKTGTAEVANAGSRGYGDGLTIGSFAGYAPIDDPRFVILVKVDNPKGVQWAESTAAPAFGKIMKFLLEYERIEPTESTVSP